MKFLGLFPLWGSPLEELTIKDTGYPIPAGALFVSPSGDDGNNGSQDNPFQTISKAVSAAAPGGTIIIREGIYREAVPPLDKPLTLQPYPHEMVWMKGSVVVTNWTPDGSSWRSDNWHYRFCHSCVPDGVVLPTYQTSGMPDMVFINNLPLRQVARREEVVDGAFYVDEAAHQLFIGSDPTGQMVEAAAYVHAMAMKRDARGTVIRGLGFAHYAPYAAPDQMGMIFGNTDALTFENNTFAWSAAKGLVIYGGNSIVRGNTFVYNGQGGLGMFRADNSLIEGNRFAYNNIEHFAHAGINADAAGSKLTRSKNLVIQDNIYEGNFCSALWLDASDYSPTVIRNIFRDNSATGISLEESAKVTVASNIIANNGAAGISVSNASDLRIYNNTLSRNGINIRITDDSRVNTDLAEISLGITHITANVVVINNLISENNQTSDPFLIVRDYNSSPIKNADDMLTMSDRNGYYRSNRAIPAVLVEWWRGTARNRFQTFTQYRSSTGRDSESFIVENTGTNPFFVDESGGSFALKADSPALSRGIMLPSDIASALGTPADSPNLGALFLPGGARVTPSQTQPPTLSPRGRRKYPPQ